MMHNLHISTSESFMDGMDDDGNVIPAPSYEGWCSVCCQTATIRVGYVNRHCSNCNSYYDDEWLNGIVRMRRERAGLSRREIAEQFGVKLATIRQYENYWPSKRYWEWTQKLMENLDTSIQSE